jgi:hypothetical protein
MVSQSYRSVLEAEVLRDYRLPRSASFCSRYLVEKRTCAGAADGTEVRQASPRKLGKRASSRKLLTKVIEVPLKQPDSGTDKERRRESAALRRKGSTRLLNAGKESRRKQQAQGTREVQQKGDSADQRNEQKQQEGKGTPRNDDMKRRASSKRLIKSKASSTRKLDGARTDQAKHLDVEPAREIAFVPDRVQRKPEEKSAASILYSAASILYGSGRVKPLAPSRSVTFTETECVVCQEFTFDAKEYEGFPEVPSYEHLEHDEYYEVMAEMVQELSGASRPTERVEFTVCHTEEESAEFTVCFATTPGTDSAGTTLDAPGVVEDKDAPLQKQQVLRGDSSTASDTVPSSQGDESDESYLPHALKRSPKPQLLADASVPPKGPPQPAETVIPRTVIYQSPETKKRRRSALSVMKRTLKIISL